MLKNKQKNMKTRSYRMRALNSSGSIWGFGSNLIFPIIQSPYWYGTATSQDFKNVIKETDPSTFISTTFKGQDIRRMFDRRTDSFNDVNAYLFNAEYEKNGLKIEVQVNPEFSQDVASSYALKYANEIGRLPKALRRDVRTVWIHNWIKAQEKDKKYISTYARENPDREDIAESFLAYFAVTYRKDKDRISTVTSDKITSTIPNRIKFFDSLNLDMHPYVKSPLEPS